MKELQCVILTEDLPEQGLQRGGVGTVVLVHEDGAGYEVEFVTVDGRTLAVMTLSPSQLRPAGENEVLHSRPLRPITR